MGFLCHQHNPGREDQKSKVTVTGGLAPARHIDVDFAIFWGWGRESMRPDHPPPTHISTSLGTPCLRGFLRSSPQAMPPGFPQLCLQGFPGGPLHGDLLPRDTTPFKPSPFLSLPWVGLLRGRAHTNTTATISRDTTASVATSPARSGSERGPHPEQEAGWWGPKQEDR